MSEEEKPKPEVPESMKDAEVMMLECRYEVKNPFADLSDEELDKQIEIKRARYVYAHEQNAHWQQEQYTRSREFNLIVMEKAKRRYGITVEQMRDNPAVSSAIWYAK